MNGIPGSRRDSGIDRGRRAVMLRTATFCMTAGTAIHTLIGSKPVMADDRTAPRLHFTIGQNKGFVELSYKVQNSATRPIYVFNRLYKTFDANRGFVVDPNLCTIEVKNNTIYVAKKIFPAPELMDAEGANLPCVSEIPSGGELGEQVTLHTPLRQWHPYFFGDRNPRTATSLPIVFEVGYFFAAPGTKELAVSVKTTIGNCPRFDPFPITSQLIVAAGPTRELVDVLM
jgi:hypothetical protein